MTDLTAEQRAAVEKAAQDVARTMACSLEYAREALERTLRAEVQPLRLLFRRPLEFTFETPQGTAHVRSRG